MDLRFPDAEPSDEERAAVDTLLGAPADGWTGGTRADGDLRDSHGGRAARERRDLLLPALQAAVDRVGWLSDGALNYICRRLTVPPADAYGVATFYAMFSRQPRPPRVAHVCTDIVCTARGADRLCDTLTERLGPGGQDAAWQPAPCLGLCERAPAALVVAPGDPPSETVAAPAAADELLDTISGEREPAAEPPPGTAVPQADDDRLVLLSRIGTADPGSLDGYRAAGGYRALRRAFDIGATEVIREVTDAGLLGRGGAAFPTGRKWQATASRAERPHYLVCNADESEPGTFKDRVIMEGDPFALIEAMTIAGYAAGCAHGHLYIRGEYPRARHALEHAITRAREHGLLGADIMGRGYAFDIELRRGAGAYICGEETAVFNSIEGLRGEPRSKPPFPAQSGLFGKPTVVNNVETLVNVLPILTGGGPAYAATGTAQSSGTKLFCVSGTVRRPGLYELPFGATLRELLTLAGGAPGDIRAVLLGGSAGSFVGPDDLDLPLTFEDTRAAGTTLGSGVVMVCDDQVDLRALVLRIAAFFRDESCGRCVPCRVGTVRQEEALHRLAAGTADGRTELTLLRDVGTVMRDSSICGLGQTAWNAVESAIDRIGVFGEV